MSPADTSLPTPSSSQTDAPSPSLSLRRNTVRAVATSRTLVTLALAIESRAQLLTHAPQWVLRSVVDASAILVAVLAHPSRASLAEDAAASEKPGDDADDDDDDDDDDDSSLVRQACAAMLRCSVRDADLPHRLSVLMETFWAVRHFPAASPAPHSPALSAWPDRLGAGVTLWCMERFRLGLRAAQSSTDRVNRALDMIQPNRPNGPSGHGGGATSGIPSANLATSQAATGTAAAASAASTEHDPDQQAAVLSGSDPFLDVNWSMFMDEFGWTGEDAVLLGLP